MGRSCLISTTSKLNNCRKCGSTVLTALDEGCRVVVERIPLKAVGDELREVLAGKRTFTRTLAGQIIERTSARIRSDSLRGLVHVEHHCPVIERRWAA